ncbi:GNAT family N-acetyltransferase [Brucellaceae bacterium C25G]
MRVEQMSPSHPHSLRLLNQLSDILATITGNNGRSSFDPLDVQGSGASFVVAYDFEGNPVGCGGYRPLAEGVAELKRMFAVPGSKGVGKAILSFLERKATDDGYREMWLETRLVNTKAVFFYEQNGYRTIPNFGKYAGRTEAICFSKSLRDCNF